MQTPFRSICAAALLAAAVFCPPAHAQRLSLAERVAKLEQDAQGHNGASGNIDLVSQIKARCRPRCRRCRGRSRNCAISSDEAVAQQGTVHRPRLAAGTARRPRRFGGSACAPQAPRNSGQLQDIPLGSGAPPPAARADMPPPRNEPPPQGAAPPPSDTTLQAAPAGAADEKGEYDQAFNALKDGRYAESARRFQGFIGQYPNSELTPKRTTGSANRIT